MVRDAASRLLTMRVEKGARLILRSGAFAASRRMRVERVSH
jgi:hypothetical protein